VHPLPPGLLTRSGPKSYANKRLIWLSAMATSKRPTNCLGDYARSTWSANKQQYSPQTVPVKPCSCPTTEARISVRRNTWQSWVRILSYCISGELL